MSFLHKKELIIWHFIHDVLAIFKLCHMDADNSPQFYFSVHTVIAQLKVMSKLLKISANCDKRESGRFEVKES